MSDPKRLSETHATELEGLLLASVRADAPPPSARARALGAVAFGTAAGGAVTGTAGSAAAIPGGKGGIALALKWLAIGAGAGVVVAGTAVGPLQDVLERPAPSRPASASRETHAVAPSREHVVPKAMEGASAPADVQSDFGATVAPPAVVVRNPTSERGAAPVVPARAADEVAATAATASPSSTLSDEVRYLDVASSAIRDHDPARAHAALDAYGARFAHGNLGPEATTLRAEAFLQQGDRARAERIAEAFLSQNPHSPHAARLRTLLGERGSH